MGTRFGSSCDLIRLLPLGRLREKGIISLSIGRVVVAKRYKKAALCSFEGSVASSFPRIGDGQEIPSGNHWWGWECCAGVMGSQRP